MKTITICGSMTFFTEIKQLKEELADLSFNVLTPSEEGTGIEYSKLSKQEQADMKQNFIDKHIDKIKQSDAILLANYTKKGITNYIGANTFLEMAFAYILKKPIYILNSVPEQQNTVEIEGLKPIILHGDVHALLR
jgi:nucleoside 2-deoxyribosyltransferase